MKSLFVFIAVCLLTGGSAFAQSKFPGLEKVKKIKLLEATREDVKKIFGDDDKDSEGDEYSTDDLEIQIEYSTGECSEKSDEDWNVPEGKVTLINVILYKAVKPKALKIDLSALERLRRHAKDANEDEDDPDDFIYFVKDKSVSYGLSDGKIKTIKFIPAETNYTALCNNEDLREFSSAKDWFLYKITRRPNLGDVFPVAHTTELTLSKYELFADCPSTPAEKKASADYFKITVEAKGESSDPTSVLTYNYGISGGRIIGNNTNSTVIWDLTGVKPGKYTIVAGTDNGCGICGRTKTETVVVKELDGCQQK